MRRLLAPNLLSPRRARLERLRITLAEGARTTLHVASYELAFYRPRVVVLDEPAPLARWCREQGVRNAIVGGFFLRPDCAPLGELRIGGQRVASVPFDAPFGEVRACVNIDAARVRIARRDQLGGEPAGDLLQAGPLLVADGLPVSFDGCDHEGFSAGAHQFDSDITRGRYPRAALGVSSERLIAVACDGRNRRDAGMTLHELAEALCSLGATEALNLDGGGSTSLVYQGRLRNRPREEHGVDVLGGRPIVSALAIDAL
ncbi:MAG: phosphodiester glycosidase family protein [Solirubrobacterales bacterium]|nr:phosphodiester glycosidase family protein [Solirubrobacterales bacterium]MBV9915325.1 phosphodiester glycosidase family protein [Solirubrobacterales bacterium]